MNFMSELSPVHSVGNNIIKNQYKQLIEKLQFVFKDDPSFERLSNVNLDDPYDVEIIIPLVSKKLRDIASEKIVNEPVINA